MPLHRTFTCDFCGTECKEGNHVWLLRHRDDFSGEPQYFCNSTCAIGWLQVCDAPSGDPEATT